MTKVENKENDRLASKRRYEEETEHRIDQLMSTVENHTRTERHLEQYSNIGDPKGKAHARDIQLAREAELQHLKNTILYGPTYDDHQLENLKENYEDTKEYVDHFGSKMDDETLENVKEKQKNRKESIKQLEYD
ncbi:hypothetical protein [Clostridium sp. DJ247]|uniref:hypothetical protein n=1 Tax=Clostridium sp. DJ247 TaxID=2726188 RepID=UPI00162785E1|nr:hypothetical protein [Clostridium sp. DJ247]MBC2581022.1 hypothetical protein [Clostridium sp. DJ247]